MTTPFHWAVREGKLELVDELLAAGADPSSELVTAISYEQDLAVLLRLLDAGADLASDEQALGRLSHRTTQEAQRVVEKVGGALLDALASAATTGPWLPRCPDAIEVVIRA